MELLEIKAPNTKSLGVKFSPEGILKIHGVSCEEDPKPFYQQLKNWVGEYLRNPAENTELFIRLKYFNTSSAKCLLDLINTLTPVIQTGKKFNITWYYEEGDEDMQDTIKSFEEVIHHKIRPVEIDSYSE
jgi:hypothetical protein